MNSSQISSENTYVFTVFAGYRPINIREKEKWAKEALLEFDKTHPGEIKGENINSIIEQARLKQNELLKPG